MAIECRIVGLLAIDHSVKGSGSSNRFAALADNDSEFCDGDLVGSENFVSECVQSHAGISQSALRESAAMPSISQGHRELNCAPPSYGGGLRDASGPREDLQRSGNWGFLTSSQLQGYPPQLHALSWHRGNPSVTPPPTWPGPYQLNKTWDFANPH